METIERLKQLVRNNCLALIDEGHDVIVNVAEGEENVVFEVRCPQQGDVGLIIGKNGQNIEAIRTLVRGGCRGAILRTGVEVMNSRR